MAIAVPLLCTKSRIMEFSSPTIKEFSAVMTLFALQGDSNFRVCVDGELTIYRPVPV